MKTPWGEIAVSDAHVHLFSHAFLQSLAKQKGVAVEDCNLGARFRNPARRSCRFSGAMGTGTRQAWSSPPLP